MRITRGQEWLIEVGQHMYRRDVESEMSSSLLLLELSVEVAAGPLSPCTAAVQARLVNRQSNSTFPYRGEQDRDLAQQGTYRII